MSDVAAAGATTSGTGHPSNQEPDRTERYWAARNIRRALGVAAVLAVVVAMLIAPAAAGAAEVAPDMENAAARAAVLALTGDGPDRVVLPADFAASQGYRPIELDGMTVDPGGQCSSPVSLPAEFDTACKAHDLGYDLLRYAELRGHPLGPWARRAVDNALEQRMFTACAGRDDTLSRLRCTTMAAVATAAVDLNSRRQNYAAPMPEYLFGAQLSGTDSGPRLVRVLASVAVVLLLVAALFAIVRRLLRQDRSGGRSGRPLAPMPDDRPSPISPAAFARGYLVRIAHMLICAAHGARALVGPPEMAIATTGARIPDAPGFGASPAALRISHPRSGATHRRGPSSRGAGIRADAGPRDSTLRDSGAADGRERLRAAITRRGAAIRPPRLGALIATAAGTTASLSPGLLPRTSIAQALLTAILALLALAVSGLGRKLLGRFGADIDRRFARYRHPIAATAATAVMAALGYAWHWQNQLRAAMHFPPAGLWYWLHWALGVAAIVVPVLLVARGLRRATRSMGSLRAVTLISVIVIACHFALLPAAASWQRSAFAAADAAVDPDVVRPVSATRSGSPESAVSWSSLGAEGRKFVSERGASARVYIGLRSAPDLDSRVALAIRELERSGGFDRGNLVMMVPTGSGWLDARAARGLDERFGGDATLIGMQYSQAPSWATFLFARADAEQSARALFTGIEQRLAGMAHPPKLYLYGQSLGATAGSAIFDSDRDERARVCAALWAGPPVSAVHRGGATVLANSSDPVVQWSPRLLWHAPDLGDTRRDAPRPPWLPVLGWVQTTADMLSALAPGPGHGHRYDSDQGTALGSC
ncbi:alpha/beta-hydrolase family protein [Nocardia spumae]|uniref:alpha/beta-hydrolase family protein n=1 Tax=Nocardia spumae TaxID=2887190 RepID=UPI001D152B3C|nr:alpha/beta-hydrolase family protein [Nocardia spumae]